MPSIEAIPGKAFLAFPDMMNMLAAELSGRFGYGELVRTATISGQSFSASDRPVWYGNMLYCPSFSAETVPYWAKVCMEEPFVVHFDSIGEVASVLKSMQRNWAPYQYTLFRRAALIQEKLPYINLKARSFPCSIPNTPMGLYTLIDKQTMIASAVTSSPFPAGAVQFVEDHDNPPSRAYLKLQESLTFANAVLGVELPKSGDKCFEAGACPGGWTWVLRKLGADVLAVDRTELAPSLMGDPHVKFRAHDAFTLAPDAVCGELGCSEIDWLFSDVICYPARLLEWIEKWRMSGKVRNMICTIKMQGAVDWNLMNRFADIPNARIVHLNYNKHELTVIIARP